MKVSRHEQSFNEDQIMSYTTMSSEAKNISYIILVLKS